MSLDSIAKRGFPFIVGVMIAIAAYFQASGISHLIAYEIARDGAPPVRAPVDSDPASSGDHPTSAGPILTRNAFDSTTGPLEVAPDAGAGGPADPASRDPRNAPGCDKGRVVLIAASTDPEWSFVAIEVEEGKTELARRGSTIAGKTLEAIAWDRVWLTSGGARCQLLLGEAAGSGGKTEPPPNAAPREPPRAAPAPAAKGTGEFPGEIASRIRKVSDTEIEIDREAARAILAQPELVTQTSIAVPDMRDGKAVGLKFMIKPGTVLESLGLQTGDTVRSLNGIDLTDPQKAMAAYGRLKSDNRVSMVVERGGQTIRLNVNLR